MSSCVFVLAIQGSWIALLAFLLILSSALLSAREACLSDPEEREVHQGMSGCSSSFRMYMLSKVLKHETFYLIYQFLIYT